MERIGRLTFQVVLDLANRNKVDLEMIPNPQPIIDSLRDD
jgi:hypothetical protein